ncbi:MFS transporter [Pluralibacter gergoviae]|uniref:MFS transporter n=1 Tax=Pluralibacter gergoviae TaxID=61647 RepID=UPI00155E7EF3|nr:MFS transporter [Pluralibacter gergoviae]
MTLFSDRPGDEGLPGHRRALAMAAVMCSTLMAVFDGAMINIALPQMAHTLQVSAGVAVWFANGYLLAVSMLLIAFSALATRYGFRPLFIFGLSLFTLASLGCALSSSAEMLIAMRVLQGIGGAATLSISPAILRSIFPNRLLGRILGLNALLIAASTAVAPVLGGTLLSAFGWQWLFAINILPGALALVLAIKAIPNQAQTRAIAFDGPGALLSALALGSLIMAATRFSSPHGGGVDTEAGLWGATALVSGLLFVRHIRRRRDPLLPPVIFTSARFSLAALTSLASFIGQGIAFIALPFLFQNVYGYSAFGAALLFTPWPLGIMLVAPQAGRLADRYSAAAISTAGLGLFAVGLMLLATLPAHAGVWDIGLRSLVCGLGFGCFQSPNNRELMGNVAREHSGYASGVLAVVRTFGQCLGAAIVGIALALLAHAAAPAQEEQAVRLSLWIAVAASALAVLFSLSRLRRRA